MALVFGLRSLGLNVIQSTHMVGAGMIADVDINPSLEAMACMFGMTHCRVRTT